MLIYAGRYQSQFEISLAAVRLPFKKARAYLFQKSLEKSVERTQRTFIKLALGIPCGIILFVFIAWGGWHAYQRWEERHLVRRAAAYFSGGDVKSASLSARRALQLNSNSARAMRIMAQIAEQARDRAALDWRRRIAELAPHSTQDDLALAACALQFGDINAAEKTLASIDGSGKQTAAFHATVARLAKARQDPAKAKDEWAEAVRSAPNDESYQVQFALSCLEQPTAAEREQGLALLQRLRNSPTQRSAATRSLIIDGVAHRQRVEELRTLARDLQSYPEAIFTDKLLYLGILRQSHDPEYAAYLTKIENETTAKPDDLAALLTWMNANEMSIVAIDFARSVPGGTLSAWPVPMAMAEAYAKANDWSGLERLTANSNWRQFDFLRRAYLTRALRAENKPVEAEREWVGAVKNASAKSESLLLLTRIVSEWGWKDESVDLLWQLAKHPEVQFEALHTLYVRYIKAGDTQGLYRVLSRLTDIDPGDLKVQNNLAQISLLLNADLERARERAANLYRKEPSNAAYASTYAFSLYAEGDAKGALEVMSTLQENQLKEPPLAAYYGIFLAASREKGKAREYLKLGRQTQMLPEERILLDRAEAASK
jgi:tetratricopeptide (TPR) repeat protein